jgi:hypothetical protein
MATLDPRDPRNAPPDPPLVAPRRNDEELTERFGPPAPKPRWDKPVKPFNRERFLLLLVAWVLGVQFSLLILAGLICGYGQYHKFATHEPGGEPLPPACPTILDKIKESAGESLAVLLALLGGGTIAVGEYQRRHPPEEPGPRFDPRDPRNPRT